MRKRNTKDGYKIINKGTDARGNNYWLVYDPATGGSKYIWDKGHVWAGFKRSQLKQDFSTRVKKPLYRHTRWYNMDKYEIQTIHNWHDYVELGGKQTFEEFYKQPIKTQSMLLRMLRWRRRA